eukprot:gene9986-2161_t
MDAAPEDLLATQKAFWEKQPPNVDGMLGGLEIVHDTDISGSMAFLENVQNHASRRHVLDCGGGIGRVTKHLLIPAGFDSIDILDCNSSFLEEAKLYVDSQKLKHLHCSGLAEFDFDSPSKPWDCIWVQWCAIYLADGAFVEFFRRASLMLRDEDSIIVLKENVLHNDADPIFDVDDCSVTRSDSHLRRLFSEAGLSVKRCERQCGFPRELFPVNMYALVPQLPRKTIK